MTPSVQVCVVHLKIYQSILPSSTGQGCPRMGVDGSSLQSEWNEKSEETNRCGTRYSGLLSCCHGRKLLIQEGKLEGLGLLCLTQWPRAPSGNLNVSFNHLK